ncbi:MAG TPA: hypothetical protein VFK05_22840 [Polyangiaceae bacterium]|nr:hypothetical protein [Polyangiaceae bacterium]
MNSTENKREAPAAADDGSEIDALIRALYEVISFDQDSEPDWRRMQSLFSRHARITRITPDGTDYLDVGGFQELAKETFDLGVYTRFFEIEVLRDERRFGGLAHVLSAYETRHSPSALEPFARGVNSLQLIKEDESWKVLSLFWDEERLDNPLELRDLFASGETNGQTDT